MLKSLEKYKHIAFGNLHLERRTLPVVIGSRNLAKELWESGYHDPHKSAARTIFTLLVMFAVLLPDGGNLFDVFFNNMYDCRRVSLRCRRKLDTP